jgi:hypothetical protein
MRKVLDVIWGRRKPKYFCKEDWTAQIRLRNHDKFRRARKQRRANLVEGVSRLFIVGERQITLSPIRAAG